MSEGGSVQVYNLRCDAPSDLLWGAFRVKAIEGNRLELIGWVLGRNEAARQIEILAGNSVVASTSPDMERADLRAEFPESDVSRCGFELAIEAEGEGESTLRIRVVFENWSHAPFGEMQVGTTPRPADSLGRG